MCYIGGTKFYLVGVMIFVEIDVRHPNYEVIPVQATTRVRFYTSIDPGSYVPPHWHDAIEIVYLQEGELTFTIEENTRILKPGRMVLVNPNVIHSTRCTALNKAIVFQIPLGFVRTLAPNINKMFFLLSDTKEAELAPKEKLNHLKNILEEMQMLNDTRSDGYLLRFNSLLYDFIFQLYKNFSIEIVQTDFDHKSQVLARLAPGLDYTFQHYSEVISIQDIAGVALFQPTYFCWFFKKNMGVTFLEYQNELRLSHILRDLISTKDSISEILARHGFNNYKLFRRMFYQHFNATPAQIRRRLRTSSRMELGRLRD